jgi:phosphoglycerate dehydrogenase-like enzyme
MAPDLPERLFDEEARRALVAVYDIDFAAPVRDFGAVPDDDLARAEVIVTGWEAPRVDSVVLDRAPRLRAVLHAGGSVKSLVAPQCWDRGILVSSAADANALPVAEYAVAMILLAAKEVFRSQALYRERRAKLDQRREFATVGTYHRPVGLVGASRIGRRVIELLAPYSLDVRVYDPYLTAEEAAGLGVTAVGLEELLAACDVVSLHAPHLPSTEHMIDGAALALMKDGATLINTARGGLVDHAALVDELKAGRLWAVLDATDPEEPLAPDSPLFDLPNVVVTPHVAGALGNELFRLGAHAVDNALRVRRGEPLAGAVRLDDLATMA